MLKEWKATKVENHYVSAYLLFTQMIGPLFDMFASAMFIFSSVKFLNMCKPRTDWPNLIGILWKRDSKPTKLARGWWMQTDLVPSIQEISSKWNLLSYNLLFLPGQPAPYNQLHINHFCLFQNAILHKMLKLRFWNFKPIFIKLRFSLVAKIFSLFLVISLSWYLHLTISYLSFQAFKRPPSDWFGPKCKSKVSS